MKDGINICKDHTLIKLKLMHRWLKGTCSVFRKEEKDKETHERFMDSTDECDDTSVRDC